MGTCWIGQCSVHTKRRQSNTFSIKSRSQTAQWDSSKNQHKAIVLHGSLLCYSRFLTHRRHMQQSGCPSASAIQAYTKQGSMQGKYRVFLCERIHTGNSLFIIALKVKGIKSFTLTFFYLYITLVLSYTIYIASIPHPPPPASLFPVCCAVTSNIPTHTHLYTHIHTCHTHIHTSIQTYTHIYSHNTHLYIHTYIDIYHTHTNSYT
jgi:hypothetical protein